MPAKNPKSGNKPAPRPETPAGSKPEKPSPKVARANNMALPLHERFPSDEQK